MAELASIARFFAPSGVNRLRAKKTLTFAIMEFLGRSDSLSMRKRWQSFKFKDVSPLWGTKTVQTFKNARKTIEKWPDFHEAMKTVDADWYYVSGHHGRRFSQDDGDYNEQTACGFFNEHYYDGRWDDASEAEPLKGKHELEVYMTSTFHKAKGPYGPESNPLYEKVRSSCKGLLLIACNTLSYHHSRLALGTFFPDAVIIGKMTTCAGGQKSYKPIEKVCDKAFFTNPKSVKPEELCLKLNQAYHRRIGFGVMSDGFLYFRGSKKSKTIRKEAFDAEIT